MRCSLPAVVLLALTAQFAVAQPILLRFDRVAENQLDALVVDLEVTPDGAVWAATQAGLFRMDGFRTQQWKADSVGLRSSSLLGLKTASDGNLWISSSGGGIVVMDPETRMVRRRGGPSTANLFCELGDGSMLVATPRGEVWRLTEDRETRVYRGRRVYAPHCLDEAILLTGADGVRKVEVREDSLHVLAHLEGLASKHLFPRSDGGYDVLAGMANPVGIWQVDADLNKLSAVALPDSVWIYDGARDDDGRIWAATENGLFMVDSGTATRIEPSGHYPDDLGSEDIRTLLIHENQLFIGTESAGLFRADLNQFSFSPRMIRVPASRASDQLPPITALLDHSSGERWVGTLGGGLLRYGPDGVLTDHHPAPSGINSLHEDSDGTVWMGTRADGLWTLSRGSRSPRARPLQCPEGRRCTGLPTVMDAVPAGQRVLVTTNGSGLFVYVPRTGEGRQFLPAEENAGYMTAVVADASRGFWVGSYRGLYRLDADFQELIPVDTSSGLWPLSMFVDADGDLWAATNGQGLARWSVSDSAWHALNTDDGLPSNLVVDADQDAQGRIWALTLDGATAVLEAGAGRFSSVDRSYGAPSNGSPGGVRAGRDGSVILAAAGILGATPASWPEARAPKVVVWNGDGEQLKSLIIDRRTDLPLTVDMVSFDDEEASCAYRIDDSGDWTACSGSQAVIPWLGTWPGSRTLTVRMETRQAGQTLKVFKLQLLPAWWQRWFSWLGALGLLAGSVWQSAQVIDRRRRDAALRQEAKLQRGRQAERDLLASWLHDHAINDLIGSRFALEALEKHSDKVVSGRAGELSVLLRKVREELRGVVAELRIADLDRGLHVALAMLLDAVDKANPGLEVKRILQESPDGLDKRTAQNLFIATRTCINNVIRHAKADHLAVTLVHARGSTTVTIEDDGRGFDVESRLKAIESGDHFGILLARSHLETVGGRLTLTSGIGYGTTVTLEVPHA